MIRCLAGAMLLLFATTSPAQHAADEYFDAQAMAQARSDLKQHMGGQALGMLDVHRLEYQSNDGEGLYVLDGSAWWGGDINRFKFTADAEYLAADGAFEELELQALYSRAVSTFFNANLGVRRDVRPQPGRSFAVVGVEGVAPYLFELDAQVFTSDDGDLSARLEAEYEILLSQRLILQPRTEIDVAAHEVSELGIGTGLNTVEAGLRLRYEIAREFAPYIGVAWKRKFGETEDFARDEGETVSSTSLVAGVRVWF